MTKQSNAAHQRMRRTKTGLKTVLSLALILAIIASVVTFVTVSNNLQRADAAPPGYVFTWNYADQLPSGSILGIDGTITITGSNASITIDYEFWQNNVTELENVLYLMPGNVYFDDTDGSVMFNPDVIWIGEANTEVGAGWFRGTIDLGYFPPGEYTIVWLSFFRQNWGSLSFHMITAVFQFEVGPPLLPPEPDIPGYTFEGWYLDPELTIPYDGRPITDDLNLYARMVPIVYNITFILGTGGINNASNPSTFTVESDTITLLNPTRPGFTFNGWAEGNTIPNGSIGDRTFTAQWNIVYYYITYDLAGGVNNANNPSNYTIETPTITILPPTRTGYIFLGWLEGNQVPLGSTGHRTFTAQWAVATYTIQYILNGGTNSDNNPGYFNINSPTITLEDPIRPGWIFLGWYEGNTIPSGSTGNRIFTAEWERIMLTVTFMVNGQVHAVVQVPWGMSLSQAPQSAAMLSELVGLGYLPYGNVYRQLNTPITEETIVDTVERPGMTNAINFVAWSIQYWWVYLLSVLGLTVLIIAIVLIVRKARR